MEGVPKISMMSFPLRRSADSPNFRHKLKSFIRDHYTEDGESYSKEINDLESLRAGAIHISKNVSGCSTLKKYFCQLNFLKSRFPLQEGGLCAVSFSWYDAYSEMVHGWSDVDFEMSCILYNIGALHSELGANESRQSADGMKNACTHFQSAAWVFQQLRHNYQKFFSPDICPDTLSVMNNISLAQAQECILEKSLIDNRKSTITAKVALQIVEYYQLALKTIDQMLKDSSQYSDKLIKAVKKWRKMVELKAHYYDCLSLLYRGMQAEDESKWGERVTFYTASLHHLNEAIKSTKSMDKADNVSLYETLQFTFDVVQGKVSISKKENDFVYHDKVPELNAIASEIKGVSLVKGIPFQFDDPEIAGPDIFVRLVPMEAHEASSLYSEEKAKLLRDYSSKIEEKNEALDKFLIALRLDQLDFNFSNKQLPQELVDCCASLSVNKDAVKKLSGLMSKLSGMYHDVNGNLDEIQQLLMEEENQDKEYQNITGKRTPGSNVITDLCKEVHKYQNAHSVAAETNQTLHETLSKHVTNFNILMKPFDEVVRFISSMEEDADVDVEAINQMKRLIGKVEEMRKQRVMLQQKLRDSVHSDDITKQLVIKKDKDLETVFQEELQKHEAITQILNQNMLAQENIIRALIEANANYAETRQASVKAMKKRDRVIEELLNSYETYDELLAKCNKGIEFYTKLDTNVNKLLLKVREVCKSLNEERKTSLKLSSKKEPSNNTAAGLGMYVSPEEMPSAAPRKLKDYLTMGKGGQKIPSAIANIDINRHPVTQNNIDYPQQQYVPPQEYYNNQIGYSDTGQNFQNYIQSGISYENQQTVPSELTLPKETKPTTAMTSQESGNNFSQYGNYSNLMTVPTSSALQYPTTGVEYASESFLAKYVKQYQGYNTANTAYGQGHGFQPAEQSFNQTGISNPSSGQQQFGNYPAGPSNSQQHNISMNQNYQYQQPPDQMSYNYSQQQQQQQPIGGQYYMQNIVPEVKQVPVQYQSQQDQNGTNINSTPINFIPLPDQKRQNNMDLLSGIDLNELSIEPLTPVVAHKQDPH